MGGALGSPITDADQARIRERLEDILKRFAIEFTKNYALSVIEQAKLEVEPPVDIEDDLKLHKAPIASAPLKTGILTKRGETVKSWKARYFVAHNAKDDFKINYHDGTTEEGKLKGTIYPAGYYVYDFNEDEKVLYACDFGIKLVPWSYRRRTWFIKFNDEEEKKEWRPIFEYACYKAKPPRDEDECIASAVDKTLRNLRWFYCFWGWYADAGSEGERLGEFILDVLDREIVYEIIGRIPNNPMRAATEDLVRKTIGSSVKQAALAAWTAARNSVASVSTTIQARAKEFLSPVLEKEKSFKEAIVDKVMGTVRPFMADKGSSLLSPILKVVFKPITDAFIVAAKGFHSHMQSKITSNEFASAKFQNTLKYSDWQMDWWSGPIHKGYVIVHAMYSSDLATIAQLLVGGITPYFIYNLVTDKLKMIVHRAVYTFGKLGESIAESELSSVLAHVTSLLIHDCFIMIKSTIMDIFRAVLDGPLQEMVIKPCNELIEPIQKLIDDIPIPGLSALIDLGEMLQDVVGDIENKSLDAILTGSLADVKSNLEIAGTELGIASIKISA